MYSFVPNLFSLTMFLRNYSIPVHKHFPHPFLKLYIVPYCMDIPWFIQSSFYRHVDWFSVLLLQIMLQWTICAYIFVVMRLCIQNRFHRNKAAEVSDVMVIKMSAMWSFLGDLDTVAGLEKELNNAKEELELMAKKERESRVSVLVTLILKFLLFSSKIVYI